jgi:predicted RNA-binding Zn ribbon-like protein
MQFNHYISEAAELAVDLINSPPTLTPGALSSILTARGIVDTDLTADEVAELAAWRHQLATIFRCPADRQIFTINDLLASTASCPYITTHDGTPHMHYTGQNGTPAAHIKAVTIAGLANVVCNGGPHRLGFCARSTCTAVFVDTSRSGRQRYCSQRCGNTAAVARHRHDHPRGALSQS